MTKVVTGIDWASEPKNRALAELRYDPAGDRLTVSRVTSPVTADLVVAACTDVETDVVAVDIPFGWPAPFTDFVSGWRPAGGSVAGPVPSSAAYRYRTTDLVVSRELGKWPLSVTSDRIALGARAWADVAAAQGFRGRIDVRGHTRPGTRPGIIEVYPAATLAAFVRHSDQLSIAGYKAQEEVRRRLIEVLCRQFDVTLAPGLGIDELVGAEKDSDRTDAFIAALTGMIYVLHASSSQHEIAAEHASRLSEWAIRTPSAAELCDAAKEGWIFFPVPRS